MKKFFIWTLLFSLILCSAAFAKLENKDIIPGKSVGGVKIGSSEQDLIAKIGEPDLEQAADTGVAGQTNLIYHYDKDKGREYGLIFTVENGKIISIKSEGPNNYATPEGIKVGSSMKEVEEVYADQLDSGYYAFAEDTSSGWKIVIFPRKGIGFMGKYDAGKGDVIVTVIMVEAADPQWVPQE